MTNSRSPFRPGKKFADLPEKLDLNYDGYTFKGEYLITGNKIVLKKNLAIKSIINS